MTEEKAQELLDSLRSGELASLTIEKEDFPVFRGVFTNQEDIKNFRGTAKHYGSIVYTYEQDGLHNKKGLQTQSFFLEPARPYNYEQDEQNNDKCETSAISAAHSRTSF